MMGEPHAIAPLARYPVFNLDLSARPIEDNNPLVDRAPATVGISVMARDPARDRASVEPAGGDQPGGRRAQPQERPAIPGLVGAADLQRVMPDGRAEVAPRCGLGQVA